MNTIVVYYDESKDIWFVRREDSSQTLARYADLNTALELAHIAARSIGPCVVSLIDSRELMHSQVSENACN